MSGDVTVNGDRQLSVRLEEFPERVRSAVKQRFLEIVGRLQGASKAAAPYGTSPDRTGPHLRDEIVSRVFSDNPKRVAGYVQIYSPSDPKQYPKAATLEFGTDKPRRVFGRRENMMALLGSSCRRLAVAMTRPVHIQAFRYLRTPLEQEQSQITGEIESAIAEIASGD